MNFYNFMRTIAIAILFEITECNNRIVLKNTDWYEELRLIDGQATTHSSYMAAVYDAINDIHLLKSRINATKYFIQEAIQHFIERTKLLEPTDDNIKYHSHKDEVWQYQLKIIENHKNIKQLNLVLKEKKDDIFSIKTKTINSKKELIDLYTNLNKEIEYMKEIFNDNVTNLEIDLTNKYKDILEEHDQLLKNLVVLENKKQLEFLVNNCVDAIKTQNLTEAVIKFQSINDFNTIKSIVNKLYKYDKSNIFYLVFNFSQKIDINKRLDLYKALIIEMQAHKEVDPFIMIQLMKYIYSIKNNNSSVVKDCEKINFISELKFSLKKTVIDYLKISILFDTKRDSAASPENLLTQMFELDEQLFKECFEEFITDIYKCRHIGVNELLLFNGKMFYTSQKISGLKAILKAMNINDDLNDKEIIAAAYYIKDMDNDENGKEVFKDDLNKLKSRLPKCIRNVVFLDQFYIKNDEQNQYLYVSNKTYLGILNETNSLWDVLENYTALTNLDVAEWKLKRINVEENVYQIYNIKFDTYLIATQHIINQANRYVLAAEVVKEPYSAMWYIEPEKDNCSIKNYLYREYLYHSTIESYLDNSYHVYSHRNITVKGNPLSFWYFDGKL